jgi:hypothetical protein
MRPRRTILLYFRYGKAQKHYFICLPYLNLPNQIKGFDFSFAKIMNFEFERHTYIFNEAVRKQVELILQNYSTPHGRIKGIGLILIKDNVHKEFSPEDLQKVDDARLILFISAVSQTNTVTRNVNTGHSMISSENFESVQFSVVPDEEYMSEFMGFVVPIWHGGIKVSENKTIRPRHILAPHNFNFEQELFNNLIKLRTKKPKVFRTLIGAIQVFFESYYNTHQISQNARILLQASAFEILLGAKTGEGRKAMKDFVKKYANYPEDKILSYKSERKKRIEIEHGTIKELWADRFFTLRNHIIHGLRPKSSEFYFKGWQRHFDIATYFFVFALKRKIEESLRKQIFNDDVVWKSWTDDLMLPPKKFTGFEYDSFGRRAWERLTKRVRKKKKI